MDSGDRLQGCRWVGCGTRISKSYALLPVAPMIPKSSSLQDTKTDSQAFMSDTDAPQHYSRTALQWFADRVSQNEHGANDGFPLVNDFLRS